MPAAVFPFWQRCVPDDPIFKNQPAKNPMKITTIALLLAALIVPAEMASAKEKEDPRKEAEREKQEKEKAKADKERKRDAVKEFLKKKDKNNDSSVSKDEYLADEDDKDAAGKKFDEFNKNGDRSLSKKEIEELLGL
jgi:Flp pilus assembly protein TadB